MGKRLGHLVTPPRPEGPTAASSGRRDQGRATWSTPGTGLTRVEVAARVAAGQTNAVTARTSRTVSDIVRANVLTFFNGLLGALLLAVLATGRWQNGLFGLVIVANSGLGIVQELRAKRTLDRLAVLSTPTARVVREGAESTVALGDVVLDDLIAVRAGDQVPADGTVLTSAGLELDESLLTGEADQVPKPAGALVRSGSFVVAGSGRYQATAVGADAYAVRLAAEARQFALVRSELADGTNRILRWISLGLLVVGPVLLWSQFRSADNHGWRDAVTGTVAGLVGMVPEGLLLLTSLAFVVATVTLARQQVLVQELPAVEVLARVDVVCFDKTGDCGGEHRGQPRTHREVQHSRAPTGSGTQPGPGCAPRGRDYLTGQSRPLAPGPSCPRVPYRSPAHWARLRRDRDASGRSRCRRQAAVTARGSPPIGPPRRTARRDRACPGRRR
jgi:magnesium-transporting ATPase (P-type)